MFLAAKMSLVWKCDVYAFLMYRISHDSSSEMAYCVAYSCDNDTHVAPHEVSFASNVR